MSRIESNCGAATNETPSLSVHRVLVVDDQPEIRLLVRTRLSMMDDVEVVGEAGNGAEALVLVSALAPAAVVLDLKMPVMPVDEAIARMREIAPGMRILLYSGAELEVLDSLGDAAQPDAIVQKGGSLTQLVDQLQALLDMGPHDVLRVELGTIPLHQAITVFDTWVGLNVRILESLALGDELLLAKLGGATLEELKALIGVYAHLGDNLKKAAREHAEQVVPIIHLLRTTAAAARRALLALDDSHMRELYAAWNYQAPPDALTALGEMRDRLIESLPNSSADEADRNGAMLDTAANPGNAAAAPPLGARQPPSEDASAVSAEREAAATDREAAAIDRVAAAEDRTAASIDELTSAYLRGPGHVELQRELFRARRTNQRLALAFVDVDGLKAVNDSRGHEAGDELLRYVVAVLRDQLRDYDVVVRHGGDEFLCALPGMDMAEAKVRLKYVHAALAASAHSCSVTAGIAVLEDGDTLDTLIARADQALYENRAARPGRIAS